MENTEKSLARRLAAGCNVKTKHGFCFKSPVDSTPLRYAYSAHRDGVATQWFATPEAALDAMLSDALRPSNR